MKYAGSTHVIRGPHGLIHPRPADLQDLIHKIQITIFNDRVGTTNLTHFDSSTET